MQNTHDLIWFWKSYRNCLISFLIQRRKILYSNWKHLFPNSGDEKVWIFTSCVFLGKSLPSLGLREARVIWTRPASQILWYAMHIAFNLCWFIRCYRASLVAQMVKHLPAVRETQVWSLGEEDPMEKETATHSSILAWKIPWTEEPGRLPSMGSQRVRHDWATSLSLTIWTFVGKVMSLLFNTPSRFVIAFLPRSKHLLISWLKSSTVLWSPRK